MLMGLPFLLFFGHSVFYTPTNHDLSFDRFGNHKLLFRLINPFLKYGFLIVLLTNKPHFLCGVALHGSSDKLGSNLF
jgi:hypothetical protein